MEQEIVWVGMDIGRYFHAWCAMDQHGSVIWKKDKVINTTVTLRAALAGLRQATPGRRLVFATEEPGGNASALLRLLAEAQETVLLTQPLRVKRFHLALGQPHKSDPYDAQVIADFARQNASRLPSVRPMPIAQQALRVLSRRLDAVGKDLRRNLNRLRATLAEYAPEWLVCQVFKDWSGETALSSLEHYGRISKLQRTPLGRLSAAFSRWSRGRFGDAKAHALQQALAQVHLPPLLEQTYHQAILSLVNQIRSLLQEHKSLLTQLIALQPEIPALALLEKEFGYGLETAAIITSEVGDIADFASEAAFATYCGVTPLKRKSGISQGSAHLSRFTNKRLLRALFQATISAVLADERSQAYYRKKLADRKDPRSKTMALLALARHRTRRLYKVLRQHAAWVESPPALARAA